MNITTCARPYAKAAFEYAQACSSLEAWSAMLQLAATVAAQHKIVTILQTPTLSGTQQADAMLFVCQGELSAPFDNFLRLLAEHRRLIMLPVIFELYKQLKSTAQRHECVQVISAYPLNQKQQARLMEKMATRLDCTVHLDTTIDKDLLGGMIIKAGDMVIDGSLRARLEKLADAMIA